MDIIGRAEHAAYYNDESFLNYKRLHAEGIGTFSGELTMEVCVHLIYSALSQSKVRHSTD